MRKWWKRFFLAALLAVMAAISLAYLGGNWAVKKYLSREIGVGPGKVRMVNARCLWGWELRIDSVFYNDSASIVTTGPVRVSANLFPSFLNFSPSVDIRLDTVKWITNANLKTRVRAAPDSQAANPSPPAWPNFSIPAPVHVSIARIEYWNDSGWVASANDIQLTNPALRSMKFQMKNFRAKAFRSLALQSQAALNWKGSLAKLEADVECGLDQIHLRASLSKANLRQGEIEIRMRAASSKPYARALGAQEKIPIARNVDLQAKAEAGSAYRIELAFHAGLSGFNASAPVRLGPQTVDVHFGFRDSAGAWSLGSHGLEGEAVRLDGNLHVTQGDSLDNLVWVVRHLETSLRGQARGIRVAAGGKVLPTDLDLSASRLGPKGAQAEIVTTDGSRLAVDLRKGADGWSGTFKAQGAPDERWFRAFVDTNVAFRTFTANGAVKNNRVTLITEATDLKAYGASADSIHLEHRYDSRGYALLEPSTWWRRGIAWHMSGSVGLGEPGKPVVFRLWNPDFGSLDFRMPRPHEMEAQVEQLAVDHLPYRGLDTLAAHQPRVSANFHWNRALKSGAVDLNASGLLHEEPLRLDLKAQWDSGHLEVSNLNLKMGTASMRAGMRTRLHGKQFYEIQKLKREDYRWVFLETDHLDLPQALGMFLPKPPITHGSLQGRLAYSDSSGFSGVYHITDLQPVAIAELASIRDLSLEGLGDSLVIRVVTVARKEPWLNDSATLSLSGILGPNPSLAVEVAANHQLFLNLQGVLSGFKSIQGNLHLRGGAVLPGKSGEVRELQAHADFASIFSAGLPGLRVNLDTLLGEYVVAGLDTQIFSAPLTFQDRRLTIPQLSLRGRGGDLAGHAEITLKGPPMVAVHLQGSGFFAQLGSDDKLQLKKPVLDLTLDSNELNMRAEVESGSVEHVKSPMRAAGDFSRLSAQYRTPLGKPKAGNNAAKNLAYLKVDAVLDSSNFRYRLRSFETFQNLFRHKSPGGGSARNQGSRPLQVQIKVETAGAHNSIETDILRVDYVGDFSMSGIYPYALVQGRINSSQGELGTKSQAYRINQFEVKWLNSTLEEGLVDLEAQKKLARNCDAGATDSCVVISRLSGPLSQLQFSYDTDCGGAYGSGADVTALVLSAQRGCYSSAFSGNGSTQDQALALLEPIASDYLSQAAGKLSGHWIAQTQISGLGAFSSKKKEGIDTAASSQALSLEVLSREFWRTRLRMRSYYRPQAVETNNPWAYRMSVEWRPPLERWIRDPVWKQRVKKQLTVEATLYTDTTGTLQTGQQPLGQRLGLTYNYNFWGWPWSPQPRQKPTVAPKDSAP